MQKTPIERFHESYKIEHHSGCWLWIKATRPNRYGAFSYLGHSVDAHRFSHQFLKEPIPPGIFVCHHCDVRRCVNPDHLFLGTQSDNMQDAFRKGRGSPPPRKKKGLPKPPKSRKVANPNRKPGAKITPSMAQEIKARIADGESGRSIAILYSIHYGTVSDIKVGKTWKDIPTISTSS